jgi:selenocysteine-specific elongation factor
MKVIGTAGHVDHGKSTLVKALTGIDPDRLKEEKVREMTIDLGFAWLELPGEETVGIIDVPGHKDFIENMLAGVGAINAALLVVDAREGFMPQTREHLAILDQLQVKKGLIAVTKSDLITDSDWMELIISEIRNEVKHTFLSDAPIILVSARDGSGIDELKAGLGQILKQIPPARNIQKPRLSVDRVFSVQGYGTVVTGTLIDGKLIAGDELYLSDGEKHGRIRGLQSHNRKVSEILPGSRAAINLSGLDSQEIKRGDLLTKEPIKGSMRIDIWLQGVQLLTRSVKHNDMVKIFHLASEHTARVRMLGKEELLPGEEGFMQLELTTPIYADVNDRFILRFPSPSETIGGGQILRINVQRRYKRFSENVLSSLNVLHSGSLEEKILHIGRSKILISELDFEKLEGFSQIEITETLKKLIGQGKLLEIPNGQIKSTACLYIAIDHFIEISNLITNKISKYHTQFPLRPGIPREELWRNPKFDKIMINSVLDIMVQRQLIKEIDNQFSLVSFHIELTADQVKEVENTCNILDQSPYSPPDLKVLSDSMGNELFNYLLFSGSFIKVNEEIAFRKKEYDSMLAFVYRTIEKNGTLTVSEFRDAFGSSRKYALAFLEFLDRSGITVREGDFRRLKNANTKPE